MEHAFARMLFACAGRHSRLDSVVCIPDVRQHTHLKQQGYPAHVQTELTKTSFCTAGHACEDSTNHLQRQPSDASLADTASWHACKYTLSVWRWSSLACWYGSLPLGAVARPCTSAKKATATHTAQRSTSEWPGYKTASCHV